ncbi:MAG: FAD-dependent oxidoreductase [Clostridia bacterium]|nr:FAD-dependent oxidoreductase [Clostridia bacterium]
MKSIWETGIEPPSFPELKKDIKTDVLIIGGGIAGILTAFYLSRAGVDYILVEKNAVCSGVTKNTTAKITSQHGLIYGNLYKSLGAEKTLMYLEANNQALKEYKKLCQDIDCDFEIKNNYVFSKSNRQFLENELSALDKIGAKAEFCENLPLPFKTEGAVCFKEQAQFHPLKFIYSICNNLNIFENTFVKELEGNVAVTDKGKIYAKKIVVATHFPFINKHGIYFLKLYQHRSYVTALKNAQSLDGMYVDWDKKGLSFRNYKDYLLLGGGSHRTGKEGGNWEELRNFAAEHYTEAKEEYFWATQDCMSLDSMPYIGKYSASTNNFYTATGFKKWGMTGAMVSALLLRDILTHKENDFTSLFTPSRCIIKPQLFLNGLESTINLVNLSKKRCPHLGCALKWNKAEHSWDCPCHGSRFSEDGKLLNNPANGDLS